MHNVILFPKTRRRHDRASINDGTFAARPTRVSAVKPALRAVSLSKIKRHHSSGMRSRVDHLRIVGTGAPVSSDIAACEGQSPMISLNDMISPGSFPAPSVMDSEIGQFVLNGKAKVSPDCGQLVGHPCPMAEDEGKSAFKQAFIERTARAREEGGFSQAVIAELLGLAQDTYKQYETRSFLPHHLIPRFCMICRISPAALYTGKEEPASRDQSPKSKPSRRRRKKAA